MSTHSIIAMSAAGIWGSPNGCTMYPTMNAAYPEEATEESREGDATHELAARMIESAAVANLQFPTRETTVDTVASNGFVYSDEMYDGAKMYADDVAEVMRTEGVFGGEFLGIEARVEAPSIHDLSFGTTDCYLFSVRKMRLYVWDFKFGYEVVEAFENRQAINYVAGILEKLKINGIEDQNITVEIRICQPRAFHRDGTIRKWVVRASDLRGYFNQLHAGAHKSLSADATAHSGKHCKHCPGRHVCEAALAGGVSLYEASIKSTPLNISPEALAVLYTIVKRARKQLEALETGYEESIKNMIRSGKPVPGLLVETGQGRERWAKSIDEVVALGDMLGKDLRKPGVITPNQARNLGIDGAVISAYSETPATGFKVVPDDGAKARFVFSQK